MAVDGALVIGDISGYTGYLTGVKLQHSRDVIADLLDTMVRDAAGVLTLSKLEGDAMFWCRIGVATVLRCSRRSKRCTRRSDARSHRCRPRSAPRYDGRSVSDERIDSLRSRSNTTSWRSA